MGEVKRSFLPTAKQGAISEVKNSDWSEALAELRIYNPSIGRFLSVDPLTKSYPMLTPYQFESNTPIQAIDLDGLEARIIVHEIGANSTTSYTVDLNDPKINPNTTLYANQAKFSKRGDLTIIKKVGSDELIEIFEINPLDWAKNKWDQLTDDNYPGGTQRSGLNLTSRYGGGPMESRNIPLDGATSVEISDLITYVTFTKFMNLPTNTISDLLSNPEKIADLTDLATKAYGEYQGLDKSTLEKKEATPLLNVKHLTKDGIDTIDLPDGSQVERSFKKTSDESSVSSIKPIKKN